MTADCSIYVAETPVRVVQDRSVKGARASVVILTKNAGNGFRQVMDVVSSQTLVGSYEVVVIDSGSIDSTIETARGFDACIYQIRPSDFGHGRTRNLGAQLANGEIVVFLTQDALPRNGRWLHEHLRCFTREHVAGAFGRQVPNVGALPTDAFSYSKDYPERDFVITAMNAHRYSVIFSDVNSSIRRELLLTYPFPDHIIVGEDAYWANMVVGRGFSIMYSAAATVVHSHDYSLAAVLQLNFDRGVGHRQIQIAGSPLGTRSLRRFTEKIAYLRGSNAKRWIPYAILVDSLRAVALFLGMHHEWLPVFLKRRIGQLHYFWDER